MYHKNQLPINGFELIDRGGIKRAFKLLYVPVLYALFQNGSFNAQ